MLSQYYGPLLSLLWLQLTTPSCPIMVFVTPPLLTHPTADYPPLSGPHPASRKTFEKYTLHPWKRVTLAVSPRLARGTIFNENPWGANRNRSVVVFWKVPEIVRSSAYLRDPVGTRARYAVKINQPIGLYVDYTTSVRQHRAMYIYTSNTTTICSIK